jgi:hypothetical protein
MASSFLFNGLYWTVKSQQHAMATFPASPFSNRDMPLFDMIRKQSRQLFPQMASVAILRNPNANRELAVTFV